MLAAISSVMGAVHETFFLVGGEAIVSIFLLFAILGFYEA
jgi:hypothetical protein